MSGREGHRGERSSSMEFEYRLGLLFFTNFEHKHRMIFNFYFNIKPRRMPKLFSLNSENPSERQLHDLFRQYDSKSMDVKSVSIFKVKLDHSW